MSDSLWSRPDSVNSLWRLFVNSPGQNTGMLSLSIAQGIFSTQRLNPGLPPCKHSLPAEPQGKPKKTGVGSLSLLQTVFPTQESNWCLLHCQQILYQLSYEGCTRDRQTNFLEYIFLLKTLNKVCVAKMIIVAFKMQNKNSNKKEKITILERKKIPRITGNVFMLWNARAMYLGTMEECVSSLWAKKRSRIYTGF